MGGPGSGPHKYGSNSHVQNMADNHPASKMPYPKNKSEYPSSKNDLAHERAMMAMNPKPRD